jgi:methionyl-tRNA formyltransferase
MTAGPETGRGAGPARVVFFGSGAFAVPILDSLAGDPAVRVVAVVTAPDRPAGRSGTLTPTPVAARARELGLPLVQPAKVRAPEATAEIAALDADVGVLADFGQIIPAALLAAPRLGILGVHPSLLPRHRGATPISATIIGADTVAGVTIYRMDEGVDTGPVLGSRDWQLAGTETAPELEAEAARRGAELLQSTLPGYLDGSIEPVPQGESVAAPTRPLRRDDGRLDPARAARELERLIRAYAGWPGTFIMTSDGRIAVRSASVAPSTADDAPGRLVRHDARVAVTTRDGRLVLGEVQPEGRRPMSAEELVRGRPGLIDTEIVPPPPGGES